MEPKLLVLTVIGASMMVLTTLLVVQFLRRSGVQGNAGAQPAGFDDAQQSEAELSQTTEMAVPRPSQWSGEERELAAFEDYLSRVETLRSSYDERIVQTSGKLQARQQRLDELRRKGRSASLVAKAQHDYEKLEHFVTLSSRMRQALIDRHEVLMMQSSLLETVVALPALKAPTLHHLNTQRAVREKIDEMQTLTDAIQRATETMEASQQTFGQRFFSSEASAPFVTHHIHRVGRCFADLIDAWDEKLDMVQICMDRLETFLLTQCNPQEEHAMLDPILLEELHEMLELVEEVAPLRQFVASPRALPGMQADLEKLELAEREPRFSTETLQRVEQVVHKWSAPQHRPHGPSPK